MILAIGRMYDCVTIQKVDIPNSIASNALDAVISSLYNNLDAHVRTLPDTIELWFNNTDETNAVMKIICSFGVNFTYEFKQHQR